MILNSPLLLSDSGESMLSNDYEISFSSLVFSIKGPIFVLHNLVCTKPRERYLA